MSFWSTTTVLNNVEKDKIVTPFNAGSVEQGSYALQMGHQAAISCDKETSLIELNKIGDSMAIPPGQFALLLTEEIINLPIGVIAFISLKTRVKKRG